MKKLTKASLNSSFWTWYHGNLLCFSHQHMQTLPFMLAMLKPLQELTDNEEDLHKAMETYTGFFNTEPQIGTIIVGVCCGLEEARANGAEDIDEEMINSIRVGLMGPLAGIGDSLIPGTYIPILLSIGLGLSAGGSVLGAIFYMLVYNVTMYLFMRGIFNTGYELGGRAVDVLVGEKADVIKDSIIMIGMVVVGAVAGTWVNVTTSLELFNDAGESFLNLQAVFNNILPGLLSLITVLLGWWLMTKRKMQPTTVMLIYLAIAFVGVLLGFFDPGLSY
jgi:mannose/fructose/N-acetylgalactosamine-specific phosphotransferase system component IID